MSGCFGECKEDLARERELNRYLERTTGEETDPAEEEMDDYDREEYLRELRADRDMEEQRENEFVINKKGIV